MQIKNAFIVMLLAAVTLGLSACASYDHKDYPRESWFAPSTQVISADQFKKVETPLKVALVVNYTWEGRPIVQEPFEERPADWREQYGLELAAARYLEKPAISSLSIPTTRRSKASYQLMSLVRWTKRLKPYWPLRKLTRMNIQKRSSMNMI